MSAIICSPFNLERLCRYIRAIRDGDIIESQNWAKSHMGFINNISQAELDSLCHVAREFILLPGEKIGNSMGEILFRLK